MCNSLIQFHCLWMQPRETEGELFIGVTLRLWPSSRSVCVYFYIIYDVICTYMYGTVCPSTISFLSQLQNPLIAKYWKEGRKCIYRGNSVLPLLVMTHVHVSTVASSKQVPLNKLQVIWRQTLASFIQTGGSIQ